MTMTVDRTTRARAPTQRPGADNTSSAAAAQRLRHDFAAVRVAFTWLGVRKSLSAEQKAQAAERFGAAGQFLSATKKLLDTSDSAFRAVSAVRSQAKGYWKAVSLPYPESGMRLIKQEEIEPFDQRMERFRELLDQAVEKLDRRFEVLKTAARRQLGSLFNPADYPTSLVGLFAVEWDFPAVEPPEYLLRLKPELYEEQQRRIAQRFDEAVRLAEEAFAGEFAKLVAHLSERLTADVDGERKVFRDTAITNLTEFFQRFRNLNVRSNAELDRLVETAQRTISGAEPQAVRDNPTLRQHIVKELASVQASLDQLMVDQPRRRILRQSKVVAPEVSS
jgi:hypothetical protein